MKIRYNLKNRIKILFVALLMLFPFINEKVLGCSISGVFPIMGVCGGEEISLLGSFAMSGSTTPTFTLGGYKCEITNYGITSIKATASTKIPAGTYKLTVVDKSGSTCSYPSFTIKGSLPAAPTMLSAQPAVIECSGSSTIWITGGIMGKCINYEGSCGGTEIGRDYLSFRVQPTKTTTYYVANENDCGLSNCASVTVRVDKIAAPSKLVANPSTIKCGEASEITITGGKIGACIVYEGSCGGKSLGNNPISIVVYPTKTTTYYAQNGSSDDPICGLSDCASVTVNVICNTAINSPENPDSPFSVNTSDNIMFVEYNNPLNKLAELSIYNALGQQLKAFSIHNSAFSINLNVAPGLYFVRLVTKENVYVKKIYIQ
jgi:hypothetical protein